MLRRIAGSVVETCGAFRASAAASSFACASDSSSTLLREVWGMLHACRTTSSSTPYALTAVFPADP